MESHEVYLTKWDVYEGNVQAYRGISLTTQSILLAVGAFLYGHNPIMVSALAGLALILTWWVWFRVISSRTLIVDYYKFEIGLRFGTSGEKIVALGPGSPKGSSPVTEGQYVSCRSVRDQVREALRASNPRFRSRRLTRVKLDIVVPVALSLIWAGMLLARWVGW